MHHHLWSETRQTGYSVGVTVDWDKFQESLLFYTSVGKLEEKLVNMLF